MDFYKTINGRGLDLVPSQRHVFGERGDGVLAGKANYREFLSAGARLT